MFFLIFKKCFKRQARISRPSVSQMEVQIFLTKNRKEPLYTIIGKEYDVTEN